MLVQLYGPKFHGLALGPKFHGPTPGPLVHNQDSHNHDGNRSICLFYVGREFITVYFYVGLLHCILKFVTVLALCSMLEWNFSLYIQICICTMLLLNTWTRYFF